MAGTDGPDFERCAHCDELLGAVASVRRKPVADPLLDAHRPPAEFATERRVRNGWVQYRAVCSCGFKGRWSTLNEAQGEFRSHRRWPVPGVDNA